MEQTGVIVRQTGANRLSEQRGEWLNQTRSLFVLTPGILMRQSEESIS